MEQKVQTCVVDATTLSDHIHGIKKLVANGQLRVTVPLSTVENVEKIYQKSIEPKPEPKEATRPKSSGRPTKVYPLFDINPRVAREFLDRCKIEENKLGVEFQQEAEQYSPWKSLEEEEEEQKAPDAKPAGYAAALLKKIKEAPIQAPKVQAKPKLVARSANGPSSPWKKSVPTVSADGVSATSRPILGYTLWRLHERETYSFHRDNSILLTHDGELSSAAQKVGITVQTFPGLASTLMTSDTDLASWGDVEREFGVRPSTKTSSRKEHSNASGHVAVDALAEAARDAKSVEVQQPEEVAKPSANDISTGPQESLISEEVQEQAPTAQLDLPEIEQYPEPLAAKESTKNEDLMTESKPTDGEETPKQGQQSQEVQAEVPPPRPRAWADVVSNRIRPIEERYPVPAPSTPEFLEPTLPDPEISVNPLLNQVNQEKVNTIADWVKSITQATIEDGPEPVPKGSHRKRSPRNRKMEKSSPPQELPAKPFRPILMQRTPKSSQAASDHAKAVSEKAQTPSPPASVHPIEPIQAVKSTTVEELAEAKPVSLHRSTESTASSAQTLPSKDTSVAEPIPIEDPEDSEEEVVVFNPRVKRLSAQQQTSKPATEEKVAHTRTASDGKPSHAKSLSVDEPSKIQQLAPEKPVPAPVPSRQHRPPKPRGAPIVIDPDSFGRDYASSSQVNQHNSYNGPNGRPLSQHGPPRSISQHGPPRGGGRGGRPFIHPQAIAALNNGQQVHANSSVRGGRQNRMPPAVVNGQNSYVATNQNNVAVNGQAALHSSPRPSPRVSPLPTNGTPEPDVDFVLPTGPSRGSTRGRGKLWIP